ncbi:dihydropteroate synthase [Limnoglobus roseus]|uniref:Dihydropteroate synthase n=1 Tax=Limnoglobus roseus TaxID=2598579 RepID=A0A5C1AD65_9BACT|nr:dihydropteroate synthase [Limnoglobus roseus]QEL17299.1 dihydropteroate synthase [Limnoglobus roseus]
MSTPRVWRCRQHRFEIGIRPLILGIVNATPDSFSDGGRYDPIAHALQLIADGADLLDIGGESTRPGSQSVTVEEELHRVIPVIREVAQQTHTPISIDTSKAEVARQAIDAGAVIINDVTGLRDPAMPTVAKATGAGLIVMHMQGTPATMQIDPQYRDVVREVSDYLKERFRELTDFGIDPETISPDPGIGFGKTVEQNLQLLANLDRIGTGELADRPLTLGVSRKGFISKAVGRSGSADPIANRVAGSLALACFGTASGAANILRVHDVRETADAVALYTRMHELRT